MKVEALGAGLKKYLTVRRKGSLEMDPFNPLVEGYQERLYDIYRDIPRAAVRYTGAPSRFLHPVGLGTCFDTWMLTLC